MLAAIIIVIIIITIIIGIWSYLQVQPTGPHIPDAMTLWFGWNMAKPIRVLFHSLHARPPPSDWFSNEHITQSEPKKIYIDIVGQEDLSLFPLVPERIVSLEQPGSP